MSDRVLVWQAARLDSTVPEREHYRIEFPTRERPTLRISGELFQVVDCSETGLRYKTGGATAPTLGELVDGTLTLKSGAILDIGGSVVWTREQEVGVYLDRARIPLNAMMEEQRRLRSRYRHLS